MRDPAENRRTVVLDTCSWADNCRLPATAAAGPGRPAAAAQSGEDAEPRSAAKLSPGKMPCTVHICHVSPVDFLEDLRHGKHFLFI